MFTIVIAKKQPDVDWWIGRAIVHCVLYRCMLYHSCIVYAIITTTVLPRLFLHIYLEN